MAHVFISYHKGSSRAYARQLADYLIAQGFDVWIDDRIDYGTEWERVIFEQGLDPAGALIVIMTRGAWESKWVRAEREYAVFRKLPIFPLRVEDYVFPPYVSVQYADAREWQLPRADFLKTLAEFVERKARPGEDVALEPQREAEEAAQVETASPPPLTTAPHQTSAARRWLPFAAILALAVIAAALILPGALNQRASESTPTATDGAVVAAPTLDPLTAVWIETSLTAAAWTDTPTATSTPSVTATPTETFTPSSTFTASPDMTHTVEQLRRERDATLTATMQPPTLTTTPLVTETAVSGERRQLAFVSNHEGNQEIYVIDEDGANLRNLTNSPEDEVDPQWSPDASQIAFRTIMEGVWVIFIMNADGSERRALTSTNSSSWNPRWSADGARLLFQSNRDGNDEIYVMNADGSNQINVSNHIEDDSGPVWSPDGTRIAFSSRRSGYGDIYVVNPDGSNLRQLTEFLSEDTQPLWTRDGTQIMFKTASTEGYGNRIINVDNGGTADLSFAERDRYEGLSPDGRWVAYSDFFSDSSEIFITDAEGSNRVQITDNSEDDRYPIWSPDSTRIAFISSRFGVFTLKLINVDGTNERALFQTSDASLFGFLVWRP